MSNPVHRVLPARRHATAAVLLLPLSLAVSETAQSGPLAPIWSGMYAGIHGGADWIDIDSSNGSSASLDAVTFGGHLGINIGLGLAVVGIEADIGLANATNNLNIASSGLPVVEVRNTFGTARARVGLPIGPALLYATAGYAWSDLNLALKNTGADFTRSTAFTGIVYGAGAEVMVLPSITVRLEALQYDFGKTHLDFGALGRTVHSFDPSATVVRAGVSFRFN